MHSSRVRTTRSSSRPGGSPADTPSGADIPREQTHSPPGADTPPGPDPPC